MAERFHTVVIGGGCLGVASAISLTRRASASTSSKVCILEQAVLGAGLSSRHSAIVRSANASLAAAVLAHRSTQLWKDLRSVWDVDIPVERSGAIWIGRDDHAATENSWRLLERAMQSRGIEFRAIDRREAARRSQDCMRLDPDEIYFFEPDVLQLDSADIMHAMQTAVRKHDIALKEHTRVLGIDVDGVGRIRGVRTNHGDIACDYVVNAAGAWSAGLFARIGLSIPVALEPVYAANWLVSSDDLPESLPIIADYVNRAYFRHWRGSILHMHQPRDRAPAAIAAAFGRSLMNPAGADVIFDATNYAVTQAQLSAYLDKVRDRFPKAGSPLYAGGYVSFFDITPDLKFVLGPDADIENLVHCLGAGQALKYAPVFGEIIADFILSGRPADATLDWNEFSAVRFKQKPLASFWSGRSGDAGTL